MVTITLPPELERVVIERAERQGTTPEIVALTGLNEQFLPMTSPVAVSEGTMEDFLGDFIGCFDSGDIVPGGANLSEDTGGRFKELMSKKYREGKL